MSVTIYGASDDLIEIEGDINEEFDLSVSPFILRLTDPNSHSLLVKVDYNGAWTISVYSDEDQGDYGYPSWNIKFGERPNYEGDPAVTIDIPLGTVLTQVSAD